MDSKDDKEVKSDQRVIDYMERNPGMSLEEAEKRVKMNLDKEPYVDTTQVENLDDILILVNKYNGLPQDYVPSDLTDIVSNGENGVVQMRKEAADAFNLFSDATAREGFILNACSSYRSYEYQDGLYSNGVANYGQEYADAYWTRPGFSEHQTGLSVDIRMDNDTSDLDAVRKHPKYKWLLEHMHEYGFILRYPDDKEEYTLISPESWHLRYVGKEIASYIYENNLCLEEYFAQLKA